jgi:hypothetical protein
MQHQGIKMKRRDFVIGLVAAIALSSCGLGKPAIVGIWKCVNPDGASFNNLEFLADGTQVQTFAYLSKPPDMSDTEWQIKKDTKRQTAGNWKSVGDNRISTTIGGETTVLDYKISGNSIEFAYPSGAKCDRL